MTEIERLNNIFGTFRIAAKCSNFVEHKNVYFYDLELKPGTRLRNIEKYLIELTIALKMPNQPTVKVLPDRGLIRLEFAKSCRSKINFIELNNQNVRPQNVSCLLGEAVDGTPLWYDLASNPHTLIAGCTGSGKSTLLHIMIANLLLCQNTKLYLIDPKNVEFHQYSNRTNQITVGHSYTECIEILYDICNQMDERFSLIRSFGFATEYFPYLVVIIDEFADLILQDTDKTFYKLLCLLSQKSRAAGIHIIISTQRPSVNIIDGTIKANFPTRISCKVASSIDAKVILDTSGSERLAGSGDAIIRNSTFDMQRFQSAFITAEEVISSFLSI
jgi:DNA segregation ATPase FtsK/SpoIIIE, S-DNA-T family